MQTAIQLRHCVLFSELFTKSFPLLQSIFQTDRVRPDIQT
ncbi:hypothetical protein SALWKB2_1203 [Snodgrassella alvi wkB2]|nr:hypothetical protein SALWKB2_1203 [Snodgrassella alvi wkB2]